MLTDLELIRQQMAYVSWDDSCQDPAVDDTAHLRQCRRIRGHGDGSARLRLPVLYMDEPGVMNMVTGLHPQAAGTPAWQQERGRGRACIYNLNLGADGVYSKHPESALNPWCAYRTGHSERYFATHEAAVNHLRKAGWRRA